ncbi:hypothetical protein C8J56DRAFT_186754 [Mycena floridula]|nr:hypothetical protein C8J56DRAFT_186754 [Mycena floridula]
MESSDAIQPFPELPFELQCLFLKEMVEMVPERAIEFVSLSRPTRPIIERALYRCVILEELSDVSLFVEMLKARCRPETFYQNWVKVLCITEEVDLYTLRILLSACSGVQRLAIYFGNRYDEDELDALASTGISPLELSCSSFWTRHSDGSGRFALPLFQNVTHLELDVFELLDFDGTPLHSLKRLTHLSIVHTDLQAPHSPLIPIPQLYLADSIVVCIIYSKCYFDFKRNIVKENLETLFTDPRVVIATSSYGDDPNKRNDNVLWRNIAHFGHFARQWGRHTDREFVDMWEEAEEIVQIQRRNKVCSCPDR